MEQSFLRLAGNIWRHFCKQSWIYTRVGKRFLHIRITALRYLTWTAIKITLQISMCGLGRGVPNTRQDLPVSLSFDSLHASVTRKLSTQRRRNSVCTVRVYKYSLRTSQRKTGNSDWSNVTTSGHQPDRHGVSHRKSLWLVIGLVMKISFLQV